jgi:hypothetical protein
MRYVTRLKLVWYQTTRRHTSKDSVSIITGARTSNLDSNDLILLPKIISSKRYLPLHSPLCFKRLFRNTTGSSLAFYKKFYFVTVHKELFLHNCKLVDSCKINYTSVYDIKEFVYRVECFPAGNFGNNQQSEEGTNFQRKTKTCTQ